MFVRTLSNGEKCHRQWMLYSPSQGSIFCFMCKLFGSSRSKDNPFVCSGFDKWKKSERITQHENSLDHRNATTKWLLRVNSTISINKEMRRQISVETEYWQEVLKRVISVIKFLASRGLPFRGDKEVFGVNNNGNYLGILELISEYDPFLRNHIEMHGNKGSGHPSYLSKTICNELITQMNTDLTNLIITQIKEAKYFSIIMDSTPDLSKTDQMAIVLRYCTPTTVNERLVELCPFDNHKGQSLYFILENYLKNVGLNIEDCRGQSYDNAANMSGKYEGLQSYVKNKNNLAVYIPCTAHSLNLVGVHSVDCCIEAVSFFGFVQMLYNFFSGSTHRWTILTEKLEKNSKNQLSVLKSLSNTRWSSHFDACNALIKNYNTIINILEFICNSNTENGDTRRDAKILLKFLLKKETGYLAILWNDILERCNKTSVELQSKMIDPLKAVNLLISLKNYVASLRDLYDTYENQTTKLSLKLKKHFKNEDNERQIKRKCTSGSQNSTQLKGIDKFRVETHIMIVDKFVTELDKRITAYNYVSQHFLFITKLNIQPDNDINLSLDNFISMYKDDVEPSIKNELVQFREYWDLSKPPFDASNVHKILEWFEETKIKDVFPNILIAIRLYLTIPIANCSAERAFSKLARIKNKFRTSQTQESLKSFIILSSEHDLLPSIDFQETILTFASDKSRKKCFK